MYLYKQFYDTQINYSGPATPSGNPITLEDFLNILKRCWVECTSYTRTQKIMVNVSDIAPVIAPAMRGPSVYNTEGLKKSAHHKQNANPDEGLNEIP